VLGLAAALEPVFVFSHITSQGVCNNQMARCAIKELGAAILRFELSLAVVPALKPVLTRSQIVCCSFEQHLHHDGFLVELYQWLLYVSAVEPHGCFLVGVLVIKQV
jgi:hypothetical protein